MNNFKHWGLKYRYIPEANYRAMWNNLVTIRLGESKDDIKELPPDLSEFYDVGINNLCNAECPFCYVSATGRGENFPDICETWIKWMNSYPINRQQNISFSLRPFQIAIGSTGEPTIHPDFTKFLETVYGTNVVPNYTTNGIILSEINNPHCQEILDYTRKYVGGVAVSFGNKMIRSKAKKAIENLLKYGECKVMIHHLISDVESVNEFVQAVNDYGSDIHYHVLLPLMKHGRSNKGMDEIAFKYLEAQILTKDIKNVAFGANFYPYLEKSKIPVSTYPQEAYSKNIILNGRIIITPSSFNLTPIKEIKL